MKTYPSISHIEDAPEDLLDGGHLWILEKIDGAHIRFQLRESGRIRFGGRDRVYNETGDVPEPYQHAIRHVQERLDRGALRNAVEDVERVVFFGEATHRQTIDYDWDAMPSVLGFDVWSTEREAFFPPDVTEQIFERVGLHPVNALEREVSTRDFDPQSYTVPQSAWYDGPAEGVVVRNKRGQRAKLLRRDVGETEGTVPVDASATELAVEYATAERFEKLVGELTNDGQPVTFQRLYDRTLERILREHHAQLSDGRVDVGTFRSEVAARTRRFLDERGAER